MGNKKAVGMEDWSPDDEKKPKPKPKPIPQKPVEQPTQETQKDNVVDIDSIYDIVDGLPTDNKLYPEGTVISARPLKVQEIKMLAGMNEENANDIVNTILERAVTGIEAKNIYTADKLFLMFWLRANTYKESGYNVKFECPKCNSDSEYQFELDELEVKTLTEENKKFLSEPFTLPNGTTMTFSLLTVGDELENEKFLKTNKNSMMNFDEEIVSICKMIGEIDGKKLGMIEKYMFLTEKLDATNYAYLESYLENKSVGLEPTIKVTCVKCEVASDSVLPFRPDFFLPKIRI